MPHWTVLEATLKREGVFSIEPPFSMGSRKTTVTNDAKAWRPRRDTYFLRALISIATSVYSYFEF